MKYVNTMALCNIVQLIIFILQMIKGGFLVVEYLGWDYTYTEIISNERLRVKNVNPPIDKNTFHKIEIEVPEDLREQ